MFKFKNVFEGNTLHHLVNKIKPSFYFRSSIKENGTLEIFVTYSVSYIRTALHNVEKERLLRGTTNLTEWTDVQFNGKPVQAKLSMHKSLYGSNHFHLNY
jgi:hypothetical protein